jgi:c-di-GMP-binding flagellar brake protein YcgR
VDFSETPLGVGYVECKIVRMMTRGSKKKTLYLKYTKIEEQDRELIIKFVSKKQQEDKETNK